MLSVAGFAEVVSRVQRQGLCYLHARWLLVFSSTSSLPFFQRRSNPKEARQHRSMVAVQSKCPHVSPVSCAPAVTGSPMECHVEDRDPIAASEVGG